ncbi:hypothetical protein THAOC_01565 [Thalassiosira oceanica]|uniref:N-acetyltransferase domain-containing protein n=1 Tax=Thalassiosira oceanica TaxID=159749 RepID=K0TGZ9_THAOC|nr:hypothetical protein THAOC_01565 [Thalassiosira oceanica]|mmetsp:Transcript_29810/g.70884  ORF Transcript_29810/g.70884 Transcript_29810/m.70884 type:complete len:237 (+) Transcript_29810:272-982(+)|eukprot:EJK76670.1 hypothetical protein THAOC_01565 [Thalassiosira oceanica]
MLSWAFFIIASASPSVPLMFQGLVRSKATPFFDRSETESKEFFVTEALPVHLGPAAEILTAEFYSHRTNFLTYQVERLKTVLSLESTYPSRSGPKSRPLQSMFVACSSKSGIVLGFAEVDARSLNDCTEHDDMLRSYMYNLAVKKTHKRRGIATALVGACEDFVSETHDTCVEKRLYLRVRKNNEAAIQMYTSLGYEFMDPESISMTSRDINKGSQESGELILFAKDLESDDECMI